VFLIRFAAVFVGLIMLLPTGPSNSSALSGRNDRFCDRYPKVCDASGEVYGAFRKKLAYGITLARQSLNSQPSSTATGVGPYNGLNPGQGWGQGLSQGSRSGTGVANAGARQASRYEARPTKRWDETRRVD
jgi:hypothetical protein